MNELDCSDLSFEQVERIMKWHNALIAQSNLEARIKELDSLHRKQANGLLRDYDNETDEIIDERIDDLTKSLNQAKGGE